MKSTILMGFLSFFIAQSLSAQQRFNVTAAADAQRVVLRVYEEGLGGQPLKTIKMKHERGTRHWYADVKTPAAGKYYTFEVKKGGKWYGETPGTEAKAVGANGQRAAIIDLASTNPQGWETDRQLPTATPADLVIYEMHHRDFSIDPSSGINHKGKFLALTGEKAIRHLKELGINAVHLLPSFDYGSVDETKLNVPQYNWGYDPMNYNVPEGSYSTNPYDPACRIREFKQMVQALHQAGIRVILDVVYNHTFNIEGSPLQRTCPDEYYRKNADGTYSNGSGCGNETASDHDPMRQLMLESVKYWVSEYHIDGFRFDLMGVHDIETMNLIRAELDKINPDIFIYGEGWSAGACAYPTEKLGMKANMRQLPRIAAFSDDMRDALRGPFSDDTKGAFLAGISGMEESLKYGIAGAIAHPQVDMSRVNYSKEPWANEPVQQISYVSCHDDMCLVDRLRASMPGISNEELIRLDLLAQTAVFTSQGVPFILCGEEMLRDKKGVHNSYNSPDEINHLDWNNLQKYPQVFAYYKNLIALRAHHPLFRLGSTERVRECLSFLPTQPCFLGFSLKNAHFIDDWSEIIVLLNANKQPISADIPQGDWRIVCQEGVINEQGLGDFTGNRIEVPAQSALIIHRK